MVPNVLSEEQIEAALSEFGVDAEQVPRLGGRPRMTLRSQ